MPNKKYEREIEDLLKRLDFGEPERPKSSPKQNRSGWQQRLGQRWSSLGLGGSWRQLMLVSFLLIFVAFALGITVPGIAGFLGMAAVLLFVLAYFSSFVKQQPRSEKRWRGQVIDGQPKPPSLWQHLAQRFGKRRKR